MKVLQFLSQKPTQTKKLGELLGAEVNKTKKTRKQTFILALEGELGAGKTLFTQGVAEGFGINARIPSPTFILMRRYPISKSHYKNFYHIDCYRLKNPKELAHLRFTELTKEPGAVVVIEWADRIKKQIPPGALWVTLHHKNSHSRLITFRA